MNVHSIGHLNAGFVGLMQARSAETDPEGGEEVGVEPEAAADAPKERPDLSGMTEAEVPDGAKGVLRLLLAGHFKGVADVRLRINFYEELAALESQAVGSAAVVAAGALVEGVDAGIQELSASGLLSEEQMAAVTGIEDEFSAAVQALSEEFASSGAADVEGFAGGLQAAFGAVMEVLHSLLLPLDDAQPDAGEGTGEAGVPEDELTGGEVSSDEGPAPETAPVSESDSGASIELFLQKIADAFAGALDELQSTLAGASVLPEPSAPSGNGVAYAKFLAIYNDLRGVGDQSEQAVDTVA